MKIKRSELVKIISEEIRAVQQEQAGPDDVGALMQALKEVWDEVTMIGAVPAIEAKDLAENVKMIVRPFISGQYWR